MKNGWIKILLDTQWLNYPSLVTLNDILLDGAKSYECCVHIERLKFGEGWAKPSLI